METLNEGKWPASVLACGIGLILVVSLNGCKKPVVSEPSAEESTPARAPAPAAAAPPAPAVAAAIPVPATLAPDLAPEGVFYLVTAARIETKDGVTGLPPGTGVKLVRPGVYLTPAGEAPLRADQLTNDKNVARQAMAQDKLNQSAIHQSLAAQAAAAVVAPPPSSTGAPAQPPPAAASGDANSAARQELKRQIAQTDAQMGQVSTALSAASSKYGSWEGAARKSPQAFQLLQQYNALQKQRGDLAARMAQLP